MHCFSAEGLHFSALVVAGFFFVQWNVMSVFTSILNKFVCHLWQELLSKVNRSVYIKLLRVCAWQFLSVRFCLELPIMQLFLRLP